MTILAPSSLFKQKCVSLMSRQRHEIMFLRPRFDFVFFERRKGSVLARAERFSTKREKRWERWIKKNHLRMVKKKRRQEGGAPSKERGTLPTPRVSKCWSPVALYRAHSTDKCPQERSYTQSPLFFLLSLSFYLLYSVSLYIIVFLTVSLSIRRA